MRLFPEIGLEETKFRKVRRVYAKNNEIHPTNIFNIGGYWDGVQNWHNSFIKFAQRHNFDPLVADNWYNVNMNSFKGIQKV